MTVATFLVCVGLLVGVLFWQMNRILTGQVLTTLVAEAETLRNESAAGGLRGLTEAIEARSRPQGPGLYLLTDPAGNKIAGNLSRIPPEIEAMPEGGVFRYRGTTTGEPGERLAVAMSMSLGGAKLIVGRDIEDQRAFADHIGRVFLLAFSALSLAGLIGGLAFSLFVLKRLEAINAASRSIMKGNLSRRIPLTGKGDELDELAGNLNAMLERIEQLMLSLREVSDNIAHDLKTPLNRLRNRAEAALRDARGGVAYREGLEHTIEEADDLIKTFNALLLIARLEAGALEESAERFDLGFLVGDVAELYEPVAEEKGLVLKVEAANGPIVAANRQLIGQAVANLIDNAIKYSASVAGPDRSQADRVIVARVALSREGVEISVSDRGPGVAAADRERVLRRFVRLEESRTQPGTGLGLSLVTAVVRLHGGSVRLEDNAPGLRVVLVLPARIMVA